MHCLISLNYNYESSDFVERESEFLPIIYTPKSFFQKKSAVECGELQTNKSANL